MRGVPPHEGSFHFASRFTGERTISVKNYNDVYMKVHVSSLLPPIYRNFYPCVEFFFLLQTLRCCTAREIMCASGTSRPPPPKLSGELSSQAPYVHTELRVCVCVCVSVSMCVCAPCVYLCVCVWMYICRKTRTLFRHPIFRSWTHHQMWTSADWGDSANGC